MTFKQKKKHTMSKKNPVLYLLSNIKSPLYRNNTVTAVVVVVDTLFPKQKQKHCIQKTYLCYIKGMHPLSDTFMILVVRNNKFV